GAAGVSAVYPPDRLGGAGDTRGAAIRPSRPDRGVAAGRGGAADAGAAAGSVGGADGAGRGVGRLSPWSEPADPLYGAGSRPESAGGPVPVCRAAFFGARPWPPGRTRKTRPEPPAGASGGPG